MDPKKNSLEEKFDHFVDVAERKLNTLERNQRIMDGRIPGLFAYSLAFILFFMGFKTCSDTGEILDKLNYKSVVHVQNVMGGEAPEKFYELEGRRVYFEIDGMPVEQYFKER